MTLALQRGGWIIFVSILVAYMLTVMPLPEWARLARPEWAALVLIYWCMAVPHRVGVVIAWLVGLGQDAVQSTLLGQHALAYALVAYLVLRLHQRIRVYPLPQQALIVLLLLLLINLIQAWISGLANQPVPGVAYWLPPLVGTLLWPWIFVIMRGVRRRFSVQ
ncbi:rod shape-determining protein MreD [Aquisalimonas sp. 2447]|uniref:rod shape-determining protein MreD n=1 Tax=Aquisalimonas sp. 2447 TaxID=2740807 RepID=UPI0014323D00|nr:rod shape-determining protein MreD [Aquisalimonas sp. 2447]QIT56444.1 rod shape-determining protein MreD [Aquisalimonas sp. 2447]